MSDLGPREARFDLSPDFASGFGTAAEKRLSSSDMSNSGALVLTQQEQNVTAVEIAYIKNRIYFMTQERKPILENKMAKN